VRLVAFVGLVIFTALGSGCGSKSPLGEVLPQAKYDPDAMVSAVLAEYDRNKNGFLEWGELDACPALKGAMAGIDTDHDGKLSAAELKARFQTYGAANTGSVAMAASVTLDGAPLADATVTFEPEGCMGGAVRAGTGRTDAKGSFNTVTVDGKPAPGLQPGLYKIRITREGGSALPAKYNTQTTLGAELSGGRGSPPLTFALTSK
jgi:hypothetical protein